MTDPELKEYLRRIKNNLRVTKVVATRSVKSRTGDQFAGFSVAYNSVQDEPAGLGKDLLEVTSDAEVAPGGMTLMEARIAYYLVAMQADISAHESALASGGISAQHCEDAVRAIQVNYGRLIRRALPGGSADSSDVPSK